LLVLLLFHRAALEKLGQFLVVSEPLEKADLIYVLAGNFYGDRVLVGAELGKRGYTRQVLLGGGRYGDTYSADLAVQFAVEHGYAQDLLRPVRLRASSTMEEAREVGPLFEQMGARRILLVTSNYHSRRAALVFRRLLPQFQFHMAATPDPEFDPALWWKSAHSRQLVCAEYGKLIGTVLVAAGWHPIATLRGQQQPR
jgi:uncharacterized SAM-binding protein YcdF (DUF218 family)